jgi:cytochrome c oxidase cbb3-type subunit 1
MSMTEAPTATAATAASPQVSRTELEAAGAVPLLCLFAGAAAWLLLGSLLALLDSIKLHDTAFLASRPMLTYGRVHAAADTALLYGFGVPAALGVGLWLLCRLGRTRLAGPVVATVGALGWNAAVAGGVWAILRGGGTGYEVFEMPRAVAPLLLLSYVLIGTCGMMTYHQREAGAPYPSQWFVIGALFWFAWIFSTAGLLLLGAPARGVLQATVNWWYEHNLDTVFFGFAGLASIFYFLPKLSGRALHSSYQAALAFWMLALAGSWGGIPSGAPVPAWLAGLSLVGTVLTIIPIAAVAMNLYLTVGGRLPAPEAGPSLRFTCAGLICWLIAGAQQVAGALPPVGKLTDFTWFTAAQRDLFRYGFVAMTMFGAIYYIVPRLADAKSRAPDGLWKESLAKLHFGLMLSGVVLGYVALLAAGVWQGVEFNDPANSFAPVMKGTMMALRMSTLGPLLLTLGMIAFLLNFALLMKGRCARCRREGADSREMGKEQV